MAIYRDIWASAHGPIPRDEYDISYEIHHIDGNRNNNELTNLKCVSIEEHFQIHFDQGDFQAALLILEKIKDIERLKTLGYTPKSLAAHMVENKLGLWSEESQAKALKTKQEKKVGCYHDPEWQSIGGKLGGPKGAAITNEIHKKNGTGFYSSENQSKWGRLGGKAAGPKLLGIPKPKVTCPHCGKVGGGHALMQRWHFDNCKLLKPDVQIKKQSKSEAMKRVWEERNQGIRPPRNVKKQAMNQLVVFEE